MPTASLLVTVTGHDHPGVTAGLFDVLVRLGAAVLDVEQVVVRDRLLLGIHVEVPSASYDAVRTGLAARAADLAVHVELEPLPVAVGDDDPARHHVTVIGHPLTAAAFAALASRIAGCGANIERIARLSVYPIASFDLLVVGGRPEALRAALATEATLSHVDVAVQRASLYRRAKRLVVLDVDSTLIQDEVIELLAAEAGAGAEVSRVTAAAMAGELDFAASLRARVALLEGLDAAAIDRVRAAVRLTPGARTLARTLRRLGCTTAIVSGGFTQVTDPLAASLGIDYSVANTLEVVDGVLTGQLVGPIVDRAGKAAALERFAGLAGVPLSQTVAVGDGANDLDMLARAGLGVAFNAKPVVREAAQAALTVPYLDALLFLLGIPREEIDAADAEDEVE